MGEGVPSGSLAEAVGLRGGHQFKIDQESTQPRGLLLTMIEEFAARVRQNATKIQD